MLMNYEWQQVCVDQWNKSWYEHFFNDTENGLNTKQAGKDVFGRDAHETVAITTIFHWMVVQFISNKRNQRNINVN